MANQADMLLISLSRLATYDALVKEYIDNNVPTIDDTTTSEDKTWSSYKISTELENKSNTGHTHTKSEISDFPTSMPASDVYEWAKSATKPTYTYADVGAPINYGRMLEDDVDLNTIITSGFYRCQTCKNIPEGHPYGQLIVSRAGNSDTVAQLYFAYNDNNGIYTRFGVGINNGVIQEWSNWTKLSQYKGDGGIDANYFTTTGGISYGQSGVVRGGVGADKDDTNYYSFLDSWDPDKNRRFRLQLERNVNENSADSAGVNISLYKLWDGGLYKVGNVLNSANVDSYSMKVPVWSTATDFNNLIYSGIYSHQGVNANTPYGSSSDTHFFVTVFRHDDSWIRQIACDVRTQNMYSRVRINGTWYAWSKIILEDDSAQFSRLLLTDYGTPFECCKYIDFHEIGQSVDYNVRLYTYQNNLRVAPTSQNTGAYIRNEGFATSDTTPSANGDIYWTYS